MLLRKTRQRYIVFACVLLALTLIFLAIPFSDTEAKPANLGFPHDVLDTSNGATNEEPLSKERPKVFVIGLSKTGTTSVGDALELLDYRRSGWEDIRSRLLFRSWLNHDLSPMIQATKTHDAFEDLPWALVYAEMATMYPNAKFILTLRKTEDAWLRSITKHTARRKWLGHRVVYGAFHAEGNEEAYLSAYRNHTDSVRKFFANEGAGNKRYMEFVIDGQASVDTEEAKLAQEREIWGTLLQFLELDDSAEARAQLGAFPWSNKTDSWRTSGLMESVWLFWDRIIYVLEDVLCNILQMSNRLLTRRAL
ncbi:hypothetical protein BP5796_06179 [Coleophoma crateriformis]|uniref:P-loop containing nucleoside triphosphate hydrolase protein n=1 Tax=Coleophoma crateriformis TaxID=565419 RepID=A0A3D8RWA7_9HELO|nr:hypothetical protein BP5796_06179 [Coleophoma crateriformis]